MNLRINRDGHVEAQFEDGWKRPSCKELASFSPIVRSQFSHLVTKAMIEGGAAEDRLKPFSY